MTYAKSDSFHSVGQALDTSGVKGRTGKDEVRRKLYFGLAAIVAVTVWALVSGMPAQDATEFRQVTGTASDTASDQVPAFDGRGKWGGYAR